MFGIGQFEDAAGFGIDEAAASAETFGVDEALDAATLGTDEALGAADGALSSIDSAMSFGDDSAAANAAFSAASDKATGVLDDLSGLVSKHADLLKYLIGTGMAGAGTYQRIQSEIRAAKDKKAELEARLAMLRSRPVPTPHAPAPGSTTTVTVGGAAPVAAGPNYAAYGLAALAAAALAWVLSRAASGRASTNPTGFPFSSNLYRPAAGDERPRYYRRKGEKWDEVQLREAFYPGPGKPPGYRRAVPNQNQER